MNPTLYMILTTVILKTDAVYPPKKEFYMMDRGGKVLVENLKTANTSSTAMYREESASRLNTTESSLFSSSACKLQVLDDSKTIFSFNVLRNRFNFVNLRLEFVNVNVSETREVINKNDWIWTYKGEDGAHQYLYLPGDFGYLSFGLLWSHTLRGPLTIKINKTGVCDNLTIGKPKTDKLIGEAMDGMTSKIASAKDIYNGSYWCYTKRYWIHSKFLYYLCKNSICTFQTFDYTCCKYHIDFINKSRIVECGKDHYQFGALWWMLPIIVGEICLAFYPILLIKIGMSIKAISKTIQRRKRSLPLRLYDTTANLSEIYNSEEDIGIKYKYHYISLKSSNPITFISTVCSPLNGLNLRGPVISRLLRISIILLPMTLSTVRVIIDYNFVKNAVIAAVKKSALVGFSSIIAGPREAQKHFLYIFGGPLVALSIYITFGCLLIAFPSNLEEFVETGLPKRVKNYVFLVRMPMKMKERLSGITLRHHKGYKAVYKLFLAQILMLLHLKFWRQAFTLFYRRWRGILYPKLVNQLHSVSAAVALGVAVIPIYVILCLSELIISILYFAFPVINCFVIVLKSFLIHYNAFFQSRGNIMKWLRYILFLPMLILFCISWYMYCIIFFDGFWFLSKIAMFTYSGIIAYPKLSYGYIVLVFMAIYYLTESFNAFGESYRVLLKLSIEACEKFQLKHLDDRDIEKESCKFIRSKYGIKIDLFYLIVDRHLPRRNQILVTILKSTSVITVLTISVELLTTFNKFQDLSVVSHVFTVLFICALPKIIRVLCMQNYRYRTRRRLRQKVYRTIGDYVRNGITSYSDEEEESVQLSRSYETTQDTCSDDEKD